jgi:stage III sporulation protein AD
LINPVIDYIKNLIGNSIPTEYMKILLKSLAIAYMTQISSELCRECGEGNIAFEIETVGKIEIIILSLPLINKVIEMSREMISW